MARRRKSDRQNQFVEKIPQTRKKLTINAKSGKQRDLISAIRQFDIVFGIGAAGTGKTYVASIVAMQEFVEGRIDKIVICRPAVTAGGENLGFLTGNINDKMDPFIQPIFDAFKTYWSPNTIKQHIADGAIEITPLAYMRGRSFSNTMVIADEMQNATPDNLLMLLTRLGEGSTIVITGDPVQSDINGRSCFHVAHRILDCVDDVAFVHFSNDDVVRHPTVAKILNVWPDNGIIDSSELPQFISKVA